MKSLMSYVLTKKEKAAIVVLLLLIHADRLVCGDLFSHSGTDRSSRYHRFWKMQLQWSR